MNPILVEVYRAGVLESFHRGVICIVNAEGEIVFQKGDVQQVCYPRSAMKLLQVLPLLMGGGDTHFGFTSEEIAIMCGSHNAESEHLRVVRSILKKIGCVEQELQCGPQYPSSKKDADKLIREGLKPESIHNNCSGKHAGMLALCKLHGLETSNYIHPDHPAQLLIRDICAKMYAYPKEQMVTALDGCSAPIFSVPVYFQALAFKNLITPHTDDALTQACKKVLDAVSAHPFMVAGSKRYCTDMMNVTAPNVIGKTGAEGIFCMTFTIQQLGVCIKIDDGKMLPQYHVAQAILEASGLFTEEQLRPLNMYHTSPIYNFNKFETGYIAPAKGLMDGFSLR